jgi:hypothetical protein
MKTYDEIAKNVIERRNDFLKKRNSTIKSIIITVGCFCLILSAVTVLNPKNENKIDFVSSQVSDSQVSEVSTDVIKINKVDEMPEFNEYAYIALMGHHFIQMSESELNDFYGVNVFPIVPDDLVLKNSHFGIYKREDGEIYHAQNELQYYNDNQSRRLGIGVNKDNLPFYCCDVFEYYAEKSVLSTINGITVYIAHFEIEDYYYCQFMNKAAGFFVSATGLSEDEFINVVKSLL